jgi:hypothetical protein
MPYSIRVRAIEVPANDPAHWVQADSMSGESPAIVACYEAYLATCKMLAVFSEWRGDSEMDIEPPLACST